MPGVSSLITGAELFDESLIEQVAASLDLRQPNKEALESIVFETVQWFELDGKPPPFEAVVDSATGVGKTYIIAAAVDFFAAKGVRNFAVIAPGSTILKKTIANFTPGNPKSLLGSMSSKPVVITSDNFATPVMRQVMDDDQQVKLFIFTVQALLSPTSKNARKARKFQEGLGQALYGALQDAEDLMVFADEHHAYYGAAFSRAVRELNPRVLLGLTATPHRQTPEDQIIFRYPLAAAIADRLVKTPVLVGRKDDRHDVTTKLLDGVALLELKERIIERYCSDTEKPSVNPVMLVIAASIDDAEEVQRTVREPSFAGGRYADRVLTVHSNAPDEALAALERLEDQDSPYRIVVSVGMLKEGWDVKNVYAICSLRPMLSELLTEQTLGRGLRLPFGEYTGIEILDTLEVLAHDRYEDLLRKAGVINEAFVDRRTRAVLRRNSEGQLVSTVETTDVSAPVVEAAAGEPSIAATPEGRPVVAPLNEHVAKAEEELTQLQTELPPRSELPVLRVPLLKMTPVASEFSLADIFDFDPFRKAGERIAADPEDQLRRTRLSARVVEGPDGVRRTELIRSAAVDRVSAPGRLLPLEELRDNFTDQVLTAPAVPARANQRAAAVPLVNAFFAGLGDKATVLLSSYMDRAVAAFLTLLVEEQRRVAVKPAYDDVLEVVELAPLRHGKPEVSDDRGDIKRGIAYAFRKSVYTQDWFDSGTEGTVANILDEADDVSFWMRLQRGDLPILWTSAGREYNPDFIVVETDDAHWVVEVKMDKEMTSEDVKGKREAALRWANWVNASPGVDDHWGYLLVSETDVKTAKGSWPALKLLGAP
jgi:type III restriction enzyme